MAPGIGTLGAMPWIDLPARTMLEMKEADVDQRGEEHDQQRAIAAELATALHHLRNAQLRSLRRGQGDDHAPDQMAQHDGDQAPQQVQVEHLDHHGAGDDGQWRNVGAEPEGEQVARLPMALGRWNVIDRVILDKLVLRRRLGHRFSARKVVFIFVRKPHQGGLSAADHIMVFQTFDNTDPRFFSAADPLAKALRQTTSLLKTHDIRGLEPFIAKTRVENSACKIGITVYHQTHQR
jgi:hypothetical protein